MKRLEIAETGNTPHILFDADSQIFIIEGKSFPEDSKEFYTRVIKWMDDFIATKPKTFVLKINLFYLSSSSIISIKQLLLKIASMKLDGTDTKLFWHYDDDDEDIKKTGEDYQNLTKLKFDFVIND